MHQFGVWVTSPMISLILTCLIFLGFVYQLYSKRINFAGIISIISFLLLLLGFIVLGDVSAITLLMIIVGVILVIIELFVVGAVLGIIGMGLIIFSLITIGDNLSMMLLNVFVALILSIIEWVILVNIFKKTISLFENVVLKDSTNKESGYTSHNDRSHLVGEVATTLTDLRPSGIILLNNERIDAVSEGPFILKDSQVDIVEVEGTRVVVRLTKS
ncbi:MULTISPECIES: NfeD family protein [unclassified Staphylococcus]|uniref:NfeD family protein n=1 Tax=unclassified Staphylococcus TaxID=91994 RepID=UPI0021D1A7D3|nr:MULTISPECIES: NfeD family protein [unclassified Staphylococcus]UXR70601.1 serine protease [Staphylococcus sp. IVB6246]UXR72651.1 serine protease [Staphylococcus sp. IVB6240]UXR74960.1 serine protease [Staphylococcus sp. IVB6238]UXR77275.1 serine protease [Staphylococcus sp. IVB6233]UXR81439.1 serine protease [Staphylococcus sp. IVB6218]